MSEIISSLALRRKLLADALISGAGAMLLILGAGSLAPLLRLPEPLLFWAGMGTLPFAAINAWFGLQRRASRPALQAIVLCNACWAVYSLLVVLFGWLMPSVAGTIIVLLQGLAAAALAHAEDRDLRSERIAG